MRTSGAGLREIELNVTCDYEIAGTDDGNGYELLCDFDGTVEGWVEGEETFWTCPKCGADHEGRL